MRSKFALLSVAAGFALVCGGSAGAVPATTSMTKAAMGVSPLQQAQYTERRTRYGVAKCYRDLIFGRYRCHYYRDW